MPTTDKLNGFISWPNSGCNSVHSYDYDTSKIPILFAYCMHCIDFCQL